MPEPVTTRPIRADAQANRTRILEAARWLLIEQGADVALDQIAARAGVSIATFYRRFADRTALLRAVVVEQSETTVTALEAIQAQVEAGIDRTGWEVLIGDLVTSAPSQLAVVLAAMGSDLLADDEDCARARARIEGRFAAVVAAAHRRGLIRDETDHTEVRTLLAAATRPLPQLAPSQNQALAARMVQVVLAGLHPDPTGHRLPGPALRVGHDCA